jgi:hypothetical protein
MSGLTGSPLLQPAELLASLAGDFYFRAFNGSVTLPVAGYDYGGNCTISTGGTHTRKIGSECRCTGSGLSLLIPSWHAVLSDPGESDIDMFQNFDADMAFAE